MMRNFDVVELGKRLARLESRRQLAFGASICEGLLPTYKRFEITEGWGNSSILNKALGVAWAYVLGEEGADPDSISKINDECEAAAPASEDFDSLYVTAAQDACFAICALLDYIISPSKERVVQIAKYAVDSIDLYVQESESMSSSDPKLESRILSHPLMQRELKRQDELLKFLEKPRPLDRLAKLDVKQIAGADGEGNLAG